MWGTANPQVLETWKSFAWVEVFVPILQQDKLYGLLVLGERSSGELYSNQDYMILTTVGQQGALSIANIIHVEELRGLTQQLVRVNEEQRKRVARDLHDSVLQNLFFIKQKLARSDQEIVDYIDQAISNLRQTIKTQRSSLLDRGLTLALQDLIQNMQQLAADDLAILWHDRLSEEVRLSDEEATAIYRIVQESLSNVLKHAHADRVIVTAQKEAGNLEVCIDDNGIGLPDHDGTWAGHQFGLIGMKERAAMIGAKLQISSSPGSGTLVSVRNKASQ